MSKLLIALLALDIGVSLSKVYIFTWKLNYLAIRRKFISNREKEIMHMLYFPILL